MLPSMQVFRHIIKTLPLFLLLGSVSAHAEVMKMKVARIKAGIGTLQNVQVDLDWPRGAQSRRAADSTATFDFPLMCIRKNIDWQCHPLIRSRNAGWQCLGKVRGNGSPAYPLALD